MVEAVGPLLEMQKLSQLGRQYIENMSKIGNRINKSAKSHTEQRHQYGPTPSDLQHLAEVLNAGAWLRL